MGGHPVVGNSEVKFKSSSAKEQQNSSTRIILVLPKHNLEILHTLRIRSRIPFATECLFDNRGLSLLDLQDAAFNCIGDLETEVRIRPQIWNQPKLAMKCLT